jgi:hypothetical protein
MRDAGGNKVRAARQFGNEDIYGSDFAPDVVGNIRDGRSRKAIGRPTIGDTTPTIFVADGDVSVRESLARLIRTAGLGAEAFATAESAKKLAITVPVRQTI